MPKQICARVQGPPAARPKHSAFIPPPRSRYLSSRPPTPTQLHHHEDCLLRPAGCAGRAGGVRTRACAYIRMQCSDHGLSAASRAAAVTSRWVGQTSHAPRPLRPPPPRAFAHMRPHRMTRNACRRPRGQWQPLGCHSAPVTRPICHLPRRLRPPAAPRAPRAPRAVTATAPAAAATATAARATPPAPPSRP